MVGMAILQPVVALAAGRQRLSIRAFVVTLTEDSAMAAPASTGLR